MIIHRGYSLDVIPRFPPATFNWVYIDADHSYEAVKADLAACRAVLKPGGILAGHDYVNMPHFGVIAAVEELIDAGDRLIAVTEDAFPSYAVRPQERK